MSPPAPRPCGVAGCQYQTPEYLSSHELLLRDLELHVKMVHVLPAQQEGQVPAPKNCPKPAQLPRPELQEDATEQEWAHWKVKWERYKRSSLVGMDKTMVVDHLWACCSKELEESIWKQTGKNVDTEQLLITARCNEKVGGEEAKHFIEQGCVLGHGTRYRGTGEAVHSQAEGASCHV